MINLGYSTLSFYRAYVDSCRFQGSAAAFRVQVLGFVLLVDFFYENLPANVPRGSKYPNSRVLGPKVHTLNGF